MPPSFAAKLRQSKQQDEIEDLIKQMSKININDPTYGLVYDRVLKLNLAIVAVMWAPRLDGQPPSVLPDRWAFPREAPPYIMSGIS